MQLTAIAFAITSGQPESSVDDVDDLVAFMLAQQAVADESSRAHGRDAAELLAAVAPRRGIERLLDLRIRSGPYGDGFGIAPRRPDPQPASRTPRTASTSDRCSPGCPRCCARRAGASSSRPAQVLAAWPMPRRCSPIRLPSRPSCSSVDGSCAATTRGCTTCRCSPAARTPAPCSCIPRTPRGSASPTAATRASPPSTGSVVAPVVVTDDVRPGVVCMPHGWGHTAADAWGRDRPRARRGERQHRGRLGRHRPAVRHVGAGRHPGRRHSGLTTTATSRTAGPPAGRSRQRPARP